MDLIRKNLERVLNEILNLSEIHNKSTVFTIGIAPRKREKIFFPFIRESSLSVIGNVEVNNLDEAKHFTKSIVKKMRFTVIDGGKSQNRKIGGQYG